MVQVMMGVGGGMMLVNERSATEAGACSGAAKSTDQLQSRRLDISWHSLSTPTAIFIKVHLDHSSYALVFLQ